MVIARTAISCLNSMRRNPFSIDLIRTFGYEDTKEMPRRLSDAANYSFDQMSLSSIFSRSSGIFAPVFELIDNISSVGKIRRVS